MRLFDNLPFMLILVHQNTRVYATADVTALDQDKLGSSLVDMSGRIQELSTCQKAVGEFEQRIRKINIALDGIEPDDEVKYKSFLRNVFNMKKKVNYSCIKFTAFVRDIISRIGYLETFIEKIPTFSEQKLGKVLKLTKNKFRLLGTATVKGLGEVKDMMQSIPEALALVRQESKELKHKLEDLYRKGSKKELNGYFSYLVEEPLSHYNVAYNDYYKKKVHRQIESFEEAIEFSESEKDKMNQLVDLFLREISKINAGNQELASSTTNLNKWKTILEKLQKVRQALESFLNQKSNDSTEKEVSEELTILKKNTDTDTDTVPRNETRGGVTKVVIPDKATTSQEVEDY